jgi:hypothetical protein
MTPTLKTPGLALGRFKLAAVVLVAAAFACSPLLMTIEPVFVYAQRLVDDRISVEGLIDLSSGSEKGTELSNLKQVCVYAEWYSRTLPDGRPRCLSSEQRSQQDAGVIAEDVYASLAGNDSFESNGVRGHIERWNRKSSAGKVRGGFIKLDCPNQDVAQLAVSETVCVRRASEFDTSIPFRVVSQNPVAPGEHYLVLKMTYRLETETDLVEIPALPLLRSP